MTKRSFQIILGESIAMFIMITLTVSSMVLIQDEKLSNILISGMGAFSAIIMSSVLAGNISGAQANPVITFVFFLNKTIDAKTMILYFVGQFIGANLSIIFLLFSLLEKNLPIDDLGQSNIGSLSVGFAFLVEALFTFLFSLVVIRTSRKNFLEKAAPFINGIALMALIIAGAELTGPSMNPMRSVVPMLYAGKYGVADLWVYTVGPFLGGALAYVVAKNLINLLEVD